MDKAKFFAGYIMIFFSVLLFSLIYPAIPTFVNSVKDVSFELPQNAYTLATNSTSELQSISNSFPLLSTVVIITLIVVIITGILGSFTLGSAM